MAFYGKVIDGKPSIVVANGISKGNHMSLEWFIKIKQGLKERMTNER
jgi:hypothetical protein